MDKADLGVGSGALPPNADPQISPCTGVCVLDSVRGLCVGCARSAKEIGGWGTMSPAARGAVWGALPARRAVLGLTLHRLAWGPAEILELVRRSLADRVGTWVLGVSGGLVGLSLGADETVEHKVSGRTVTAVTPRGALRLTVSDGVRALAVGPAAALDYPGGRSDSPTIVLVVPRSALGFPIRRVVADLGPDDDALVAVRRGQRLFDLGLGSAVARFCIRTDDLVLLEALRLAEGRPWADLVAACGDQLRDVSPDRVVETAMGRLELATQMPRPAEGSHTYLPADHPTRPTRGREAPPELDLPPGWVPAATWYPAPPPDPT